MPARVAPAAPDTLRAAHHAFMRLTGGACRCWPAAGLSRLAWPRVRSDDDAAPKRAGGKGGSVVLTLVGANSLTLAGLLAVVGAAVTHAQSLGLHVPSARAREACTQGTIASARAA